MGRDLVEPLGVCDTMVRLAVLPPVAPLAPPLSANSSSELSALACALLGISFRDVRPQPGAAGAGRGCCGGAL